MEIKYTNVERLMIELASNIKEDFIRSLIANKKAGTIDKTIEVNVKFIDEDYVVSINVEDYWKYVEFGRRAGKFPNLTAILKWIDKKKILPRKDKGVKTKEQLAYLIGRKIKRDGIKPLPLLAKAIKSNKDEFYKQLEYALQSDVEINISPEFEIKK